MQNYEIERENERKENKRLVQRMNNILIALNFTPEKRDNEDNYSMAYTRGKREDGGTLFLSANYYGGKDRIKADISVPRLSNNDYIPANAKATFSILKDDKLIIKAIEKNILPVLNEKMLEYTTKENELQNIVKNRQALFNRIASILKCDYNKGDFNNKPSIYLSGIEDGINYINIDSNYSGNEIKISFSIKGNELIFKFFELFKTLLNK